MQTIPFNRMGDYQYKEVKCWLETLTVEEKDELARLDYNSPMDGDLAEITKDWIEEHGGNRDFWFCLKTYP